MLDLGKFASFSGEEVWLPSKKLIRFKLVTESKVTRKLLGTK